MYHTKCGKMRAKSLKKKKREGMLLHIINV